MASRTTSVTTRVSAWPAAESSAGTAHQVSLCVLKGFELRVGPLAVAVPGSARRLAAFLALQDRPIHRLFVAGTLWPNTGEERSSGNLRTALWRLAKPGVRVVSADASHLWLTAGVVVDFKECWARARRIVGNPGDWLDDDIGAMADAGDLLPDFYDDWILLERERFRQMRMHALEVLSVQLTAEHRYADAVETGLAAVAAEPLRESAHRAVVSAHLHEGNKGEAVRQYRAFRGLLLKELGLEPSPAMQQLVAGLPV
jgi:DNA-binding SARP family transcriptional activator